MIVFLTTFKYMLYSVIKRGEQLKTNLENRMKTIRLQGYGIAEAKEAGCLVVGDKTIWNYGETSVVTQIMKETAKTVTVDLDGWVKRFNKTRLVAVA